MLKCARRRRKAGREACSTKSPRIDPRFACFSWRFANPGFTSAGYTRSNQFPARRKVIEYTGERISRRETKRRGQGSLTYLFTLDDYWTIDGAVGGSGAEIINHSCNPNLSSRIIKGHILYISRRAIRKGEELTVDYRFSEKIERVRCRCGAPELPGDDQFEGVAPAVHPSPVKKLDTVPYVSVAQASQPAGSTVVSSLAPGPPPWRREESRRGSLRGCATRGIR